MDIFIRCIPITFTTPSQVIALRIFLRRMFTCLSSVNLTSYENLVFLFRHLHPPHLLHEEDNVLTLSFRNRLANCKLFLHFTPTSLKLHFPTNLPTSSWHLGYCYEFRFTVGSYGSSGLSLISGVYPYFL